MHIYDCTDIICCIYIYTLYTYTFYVQLYMCINIYIYISYVTCMCIYIYTFFIYIYTENLHTHLSVLIYIYADILYITCVISLYCDLNVWESILGVYLYAVVQALSDLDEEQICYTLKGRILPMKFVPKPVPQHLMGHHVLPKKCCHNLVYTSLLYKPKRSQKHLWSQDKKQHGRNSCKLPPNWSEPTLCGSHYLKLEDGCDESKDRVARLIREFHRCHVGQLKAEAVLAGSSPHPIFIYMFASQVQQLTKPWGPGAQVPIPKVNRIHDQVCSLPSAA